MKSLSLLIVLFLSFCSAAQDEEPKLDAIIEQLGIAETDLEKIPLYTEIAKQTWQSDPTKAIEYGFQGLALHDKYDKPEQEAYLLVYLTRVYLDKVELDTAQELITRGKDAATRAKNDKLIRNFIFSQAGIYYLEGNLVLAVDSFKKIAELYEKAGRATTLGSVYNNIGNSYLGLGDLDNALVYFQKALPLQKDGPNPATYASILLNIGKVFFRLEDYKQAEENYFRGLEKINEEEHPRVFLEAQGHLGKLYHATNQLMKSLRRYKVAERVALKHNNKGKLFYYYLDQVELAIEMNDLQLLDELLEKLETLELEDMDASKTIALLYIKALALVEHGAWQEADGYVNRIIAEQSYEAGYYSMQDSLSLAIKIKSELGKVEEAKQILLESLALYEQQTKENKDALMAQYAQLYKVSQKEQEVQKLQEQTLRQQNTLLLEQKQSRQRLFIFILASFFLLALMVFIVQRSRNLAQQKVLSEQLLDDKKQFFADISHELRTPLAVLKLKVEEIEYNITKDPKSAYKFIHEKIDSYNKLIDDISLLAQKDQAELELNFSKVNLETFFTGQVEDLRSLASEHNLDVESNIHLNPDSEASFDADRIRQVLVNLFSNACRYTDSPGVINFRTSIKSNNLRIVIEDSAPGIPQEQLNKVFERLYRADRSRSRRLGGSGLGLSICESLVSAHNGTIDVDHSGLGGVKFTINLPVITKS